MILDAAAQMLSGRGTTASLADIAKAAGVTQGGQRHHLPSRKALLRGVVEDSSEHLWNEIHEHVDLSENRPDKLLRGYIQALTGDSDVLSSSNTLRKDLRSHARVHVSARMTWRSRGRSCSK